VYTSTSNLSWALAQGDRYLYAIPMLIGLVGGGVSIGILL
jgi:hypothetical protein